MLSLVHLIYMAGDKCMRQNACLSFSSVSFGISFELAVQLPFTVFLYSPFPDNYSVL